MTASDDPAPRPRLPKRREEPSGDGPRHATWLALVGLTVITSGLIGLIALVMPEIQLVILLVGAFTLVFGGHYLLWGYWLERSLSKERQEQPVEFWRRSPPPEPSPTDVEE